MTAQVECWFTAGWGQMDFNGHLANTAYLDMAADSRMLFFAGHGFPMTEFARQKFGPVIRRDELEYLREVRLLERVRVDLVLGGLSADAGRFRMINAFWREDGTLVARVTSHGGWLGLEQRRLIAPPAALADVLRQLPRSHDYAPIEDSRR